MQAVRDKFINRISSSTADAVSAYFVLQIGIDSHKVLATQYPTAKIRVGDGNPGEPGIRVVKYTPTHLQTQDKLSGNRNIILELYLSQIVQEWFDFLADIYEKAIDDNLKQNAGYGIPHSKIKVDLSLSTTQLTQQIKASACKNFDFLNAKEKLNTIEKTLSQDLSSLTSQKQLLSVNITVRNILQHAAGVVSKDDLKNLGLEGKYITEDHGIKTISIRAGDRVSRTIYDIENFTDSLIDIAKALIP